MSWMLTVKVHCDVKGTELVAEHVTVVNEPSTNIDPDVGEQVTVGVPRESFAVGVKVTETLGDPSVGLISLLGGQVIVGAFDELTVIFVVQLDCKLALSVAVQVTTVVPIRKFDPDWGLHPDVVIPEPDVAVKPNVATALAVPPVVPVGLIF